METEEGVVEDLQKVPIGDLVGFVGSKVSSSEVYEEDLMTLSSFFGSVKLKGIDFQKVTTGEMEEGKMKEMYHRLMIGLYGSDNLRQVKKMERMNQSLVKKKMRIRSCFQALAEEKKMIKKQEETFYRNYSTLFVSSKTRGMKKKKKVSGDKILKFFKDEIIQKDQLTYKYEFMIQELRKKLKLANLREQQNSQTKMFSKIDFSQLKIENTEMRSVLSSKSSAILRLKKKILGLKHLKNAFFEKLNRLSKEYAAINVKLERKERHIKKVKKSIILVEKNRRSEQLKNKQLVQFHSQIVAPKTIDYIVLIRNLNDVKKSLVTWSRKRAISANGKRVQYSKFQKLKRFVRRDPKLQKFTNLSSLFCRNWRPQNSQSGRRIRMKSRAISSSVASIYSTSKSVGSVNTNRTS